MALIFLTEKLNGVKLRKGDEEVDTNDIHKTCEEIMGNCKKANTMSNIAIVCGILSILINVLPFRDLAHEFINTVFNFLVIL